MKAKFEEIVNVAKIGTAEAGDDLKRVVAMAEEEPKKLASFDAERVEVMMIDNQFDFISPQGALPVEGAVADTERLCRFIYKFMDKIYRIRYTLDWHGNNHIFFPNAWVYGKDFTDENGEHKEGENVLPGVTVITSEGIKEGKFKTKLKNEEKALTYVKNVEAGGEELRIWPYHCKANSRGAELEGELGKLVTYHEIVRNSRAKAYYKGQDEYSEQYGAIEAEYAPNTQIRLDILKVFEEPELAKIYLVGQAKSHCFLRTLQQIVKYFAHRPDILRKIVVLEDCTSCIGGFEQKTAEEMEKIKAMGIRFVKSTDVTDICAA